MHLNRQLSCSWSQVCMAVASPLSFGKRGFDAQQRPRSSISTRFTRLSILDTKGGDRALSTGRGTLLLPRSTCGTRYGLSVVIIHDRTLLRLLRRFRRVSFYPQKHSNRQPPLPWPSRFDQRPKRLATSKRAASTSRNLALLASQIMDPALQRSYSRNATALQAEGAALLASLQLQSWMWPVLSFGFLLGSSWLTSPVDLADLAGRFLADLVLPGRPRQWIWPSSLGASAGFASGSG